MKLDLAQFRDTFFEEAAEHLAQMEAGLLDLDGGADIETLHSIFRSAHSIKGGSGTFGFTDVARFTHTLENLFDKMREGTIPVTPGLTRVLLDSLDVLKDLIAAAQQGRDAPVEAVDEMLREMARFVDGSARPPPPAMEAPVGSTETLYTVEFVPRIDFFNQGQDPQLLIREIGDLGEILSVEADLARLPDLAVLDPELCYAAWTIQLRSGAPESDIRDVFMFVEDSCDLRVAGVADETAADDAKPVPDPTVVLEGDRRSKDRRRSDRRAGTPMDSNSLRVATDKVDALINLVGELVISQAMVNEVADNFESGKLHALREALLDVARNTTEIQERVMSIRMVPVGTVFSRFPRMVHDLAGDLGKEIVLEMSGVETEIDKGLIERIGDPLTHLIRNAVDHGIESPDDRRALGKPVPAVITLRAFHESGNVIIEVTDDGRGLDRDRILEKALERGVVDESDVLTDDNIYDLVFTAGFSTADEVSDLSGRGVGMDVVRRNIESLSGSVNASSEPGYGSRVRIRLPLTLAILDGLSVKVAEQVYVIPLLSILESLRPEPQQMHLLLGKGEVMTVRGEAIPIIRVSEAFNVAGAVARPEQGIVVVVELDQRRFGLFVDDLLGQSQIVVKNIEANFKKVEGVMGATILGDGNVALILDLHDLQRLTAPPADAKIRAAGVDAVA